MVDKQLIGDIFGWIGTAITLYFFLSPGIPFFKLIRGQIEVKDAPGLLLIFSLLNCLLWLNYGLLTNRAQVYSTNGAGSGFTLIFITIFLIYLTKQNFLFTLLLILALIAVMGAISYLSFFIIYYKYVGISANVFNVLMYGATGEKIYRVFKTKNYKLMPIFSIIGAFFSAMCWLIYGTFDYDLNVIIPNALGVMLSFVQLIVYYYFYYLKRAEEKFVDNDDDKLI